MSKNKKYCVYIHTRKSDGKPFYVGKGLLKRARSFSGRSEYWKRIKNKYGINVLIVKSGISESCAFSIEKILIRNIGRGNLCNMTDGGEGTSGRVPSESQRLKCSISNSGKITSQKTKEAARRKNSKPIGTRCGLIFKSMADASRFINPKNPHTAKVAISYCANGKGRQSYGYEWAFIIDGNLDFKYVSRMSQPRPKRHKAIKNNLGEEFISVTSAVAFLKDNGHPKATTGAICRNLKGRAKSACGRRWEYV